MRGGFSNSRAPSPTCPLGAKSEELVEVKGLIEARLERPKILTPTIVAVAPDATQLEVVKAVRMITGQRLTDPDSQGEPGRAGSS